MIEIQNLTKTFKKNHVLKGLQAQFEQGKVTGLVGPNACGKTTLIRSILGLTIPDEGQILMEGKPLDPSGQYRNDIGYMPQAPQFPQNLTLRELLKMIISLRGKEAPQKDFLISFFEFEGILDQSLDQLSGGTKQKASAIIAFMFSPKLAILDEPTAGLDPISAVRFKELIQDQHKKGVTIILASHVISEMESIAENIVFLNDGKAPFTGKISNLLEQTKSENLEEALLKLFRKTRI